jgi:hypothetical protein
LHSVAPDLFAHRQGRRPTHCHIRSVNWGTHHGQTQRSLVGKERGALRAFSLGRSRPVSRLAPKIAAALWPCKFGF